jgi:eukaryotic translation initiation factor 2C
MQCLLTDYAAYGIDVDPNQPVVNVGSRQNPTYLPVDVLEVPAGQAVGSKLSPNQTSRMLKFAVIRRNPAENALAIETRGVNMLGIGEQHHETLVSMNGIKRFLKVAEHY